MFCLQEVAWIKGCIGIGLKGFKGLFIVSSSSSSSSGSSSSSSSSGSSGSSGSHGNSFFLPRTYIQHQKIRSSSKIE